MNWRDRDYSRSGFGMGGSGGGAANSLSMTKKLLIINIIVAVVGMLLYGAQRGSNLSPEILGHFSIEKALYGFQLWRWFTYQFIHAGLWHLVVNMIGLYFFGPLMEQYWGSRRFLAFYLLCGASGAVVFTALAFVPGLLNVGLQSRLIGASGSVFGILMGCAVLYPHHRVMLIIPPIPMSMRTLAMVFMGIAVFSLVVGSSNAGGEAAHLGGAALGWLLIKRPGLMGFADGLGITFMNMKIKQQQRTAQRSRQREQANQAEVDRVLDKVRNKGLQSLTAREKRILQRATDRQQGD